METIHFMSSKPKSKTPRPRASSSSPKLPESPELPVNRRASLLSGIAPLIRSKTKDVFSPEGHVPVPVDVSQLAKDYDENKVVLLQSAIRRWQIQSHVLGLTLSTPSYRLAIHTAIEQLISHEESYITLLSCIDSTYFTPLLGRSLGKGSLLSTTPSLSLSVLENLFFDMKRYLAYHKNLLNKLERTQDNFPFTNVFYIFQMHSLYLGTLYDRLSFHLEQSEETYASHVKGNKLVSFYFSNKAREHIATGYSSFKKLIACPSVYILQYPLLFDALLHSLTPFKGTAFYNQICNSASMVRILALKLKLQLRASTSKKARQMLERKITGYNQWDAFFKENPNRCFIKHGNVENGHKKLGLFIFTDVLVITRRKGSKYPYLDTHALSTVELTDIRYSPSYPTVYYRIILPKRKYGFSELTLSGVCEVLGEILPRAHCSKMICKDIAEYPSGVSPLLLQTVYYLDKSQLKTGLFRTIRPAGKKSLEDCLRDNEESSIHKLHRDELATMLSTYLDFLPQTMKIASSEFVGKLKIDSKTGKLPTQKKLTRQLNRALRAIPENVYPLFDYILYFISRLSQHPFVSEREILLNLATRLFHNNEPTISLRDTSHFAPIIIELLSLFCKRTTIKKDPNHKGQEKQPFPSTAFEFFNVDYFSEWWRLFRSNNRRFMQHVTQEDFFASYFDILRASKRIEETYSILSSTILQSHCVSLRILKNSDIFYQLVDSLVDPEATEASRYHLCKTLYSTAKVDLQSVTKLLLAKPVYSEKIVSSLRSGNLLQCCSDFITLSSNHPVLHPLVLSWCEHMMLYVTCIAVHDDTQLSSDCLLYSNLCDLLALVLRNNAIFKGKCAVAMKTLMEQHSEKLVHFALYGRSDLAEGALRIIEAAVEIYEGDIEENEEVISSAFDDDIRSAPTLTSSFPEPSEDIDSDSDSEESEIIVAKPRLSSRDRMPSNRRLSISNVGKLKPKVQEPPESLQIKLAFVNGLMKEENRVNEVMLGTNKKENQNYGWWIRYCLLQVIGPVLLQEVPKNRIKIVVKWFTSISILFFKNENQSIIQTLFVDIVEKLLAKPQSPIMDKFLEKGDFFSILVEVSKPKLKLQSHGHIKKMITLLLNNPTTEEKAKAHPSVYKTLQSVIK